MILVALYLLHHIHLPHSFQYTSSYHKNFSLHVYINPAPSSTMFFDFKPAIILALVASISAAPTASEGDFSLEVRAGKPIKDVNCNGKKFTREQIVATKNVATTQHGKYPEVYGNKENLFGTQKQLWEFPLMDPVYSSMYLSASFGPREVERNIEKHIANI
ncbi:hypothetical protein ACMFMF_002703 [Clarireedia jacksonii]